MMNVVERYFNMLQNLKMVIKCNGEIIKNDYNLYFINEESNDDITFTLGKSKEVRILLSEQDLIIYLKSEDKNKKDIEILINTGNFILRMHNLYERDEMYEKNIYDGQLIFSNIIKMFEYGIQYNKGKYSFNIDELYKFLSSIKFKGIEDHIAKKVFNFIIDACEKLTKEEKNYKSKILKKLEEIDYMKTDFSNGFNDMKFPEFVKVIDDDTILLNSSILFYLSSLGVSRIEVLGKTIFMKQSAFSYNNLFTEDLEIIMNSLYDLIKKVHDSQISPIMNKDEEAAIRSLMNNINTFLL